MLRYKNTRSARLLRRLAVSGLFFLLSAAACRAEFIWGMNGHPLTSYPGVSIEQQVEYLRELGVRSYRVDVKSPDSIATLDRLIEEAGKHGIDILPVLTPEVDLEQADVEQIYTVARRLAFELVRHFQDKIPVWELGNELENYAIILPCEMRDDGTQYPCEWGPAGGLSPLDYFGPRWAKAAAVLKGLSDGVEAAGTNVKTAMGTAGWGHLGAFERMKADGLDWDITVWHMYGEDPEWALKELVRFGKPIWITEFNHPNGSMKSEEEQAEGLAHWMDRIEQLSEPYAVEAAHIYELMDETYWAPDFEAFMGLVELEKDGQDNWQPGERKLAFFTVREFLARKASEMADQGAATTD
jgi:hypothetical protein